MWPVTATVTATGLAKDKVQLATDKSAAAQAANGAGEQVQFVLSLDWRTEASNEGRRRLCRECRACKHGATCEEGHGEHELVHGALGHRRADVPHFRTRTMFVFFLFAFFFSFFFANLSHVAFSTSH